MSILRVKLIAIFLGPSGIGLLGLLQNLNDFVSTGAGLGLSSSGVRNIALTHGDPVAFARTRHVLLWALTLQGAVAAAVIWGLRSFFSEQMLHGAVNPETLGYIAISVWGGLIASAMTAVIQGLRLINDLSRVIVLGALIGSILGLLAIYIEGIEGLPILVLMLAAGRLATAAYFLKQASIGVHKFHSTLRESVKIWLDMLRLGGAFMVASLLAIATLLSVRTLIQQRLGFEGLGQFEAAWTLSATYVGFILQAMAADYYPRLSASIEVHAQATRLVNQQIQIGLILGGPLLVLMIGLAPIAVGILYSSKFDGAIELIQWQSVGNVFKLSAWALGFIVAAKGRGLLFFFLEMNFNFLFLVLTWCFLDSLQVVSAGPAIAIAYFIHFVVALYAARELIGFRFDFSSLFLQSLYGLATVALLIIAHFWPMVGVFASVFCACVGGIIGLRFLLNHLERESTLATKLKVLYNRFGV